MTRAPRVTRAPRERVLVCGVRGIDPDCGVDVDLSEAVGLVQAADADVVGEPVVQRKQRADAATLLGSGKVAEVLEAIQRHQPDAVAVDNDLTPAQIRNLEKAWGLRVFDRSELILDIFARRARTKQARLQVELAQSEYLAPRLKRMWTHLERTEGAIGTRGPGETQLETDKRLLKKRIRDLREELGEIEERRRREVRSRGDVFTVGLVGYTNAGKSTLLNRLTGAREFVADMLFATLDTRTRQWRLCDGRTVLLSDTVGFLRRLPHHLVASFHATLEEALEADLLLHVVDASHPEAAAQIAAVDAVLAGLSHDPADAVLVFNKLDRVVDPISIPLLLEGRKQEAVYVSAESGEGLDRLDAVVRARLDVRSRLVDVFVQLADGRSDSQVRRLARPLEEELLDGGTEKRMRVRLTEGELGSLRRACGSVARIEPVRGLGDGTIETSEDFDASGGEADVEPPRPGKLAAS